VREVFERERHDRAVAELRQRFGGFGQSRVQLRGRREVDGAFLEGVPERWGDLDEVCGAGPQEVHELGRVFYEGGLGGQRMRRLLQRGRAFDRRFFELLGDRRTRREERVQVRVLVGL